MSHYYNEIDVHAVAWLRQLIREGHLPAGEVDERSIEDVQPADLTPFRQCHFFAGIGGWALAAQFAGWPSDRVLWTGSCPCQPFSTIGRNTGFSDERHLWPEFARLIAKCQPPTVVGEQVASRLGREWLAGVFRDVEGMGYACAGADLCSASLGAPIRRQRLYWVAQSSRARLEGHSRDVDDCDQSRRQSPQSSRSTPATSDAATEPTGMDAMPRVRRVLVHTPQRACSGVQVPSRGGVVRSESLRAWDRSESVPCADGWRRVEPGSFPLATRIPARVVRLRGYGNAISPQVGAAFLKSVMEVIDE